jgi:hypothetical protein
MFFRHHIYLLLLCVGLTDCLKLKYSILDTSQPGLPGVLAMVAPEILGTATGGSTAQDPTPGPGIPQWTTQAYLKAPNPDAGDYFGSAVSLSEDTIVVGAYEESSSQSTICNAPVDSTSCPGMLDNAMSYAGAAYVYVRSGTTWTTQAYLKAPNPNAGDLFGHVISISGDTIVVGANYEDSNQSTICNAPVDSASCPGMLDNSLSSAGAAYVYVRSGATWTTQAYLKAPNPDAGDLFGYYSVSLSGDTIVVGANFEDSNQSTICNAPVDSASCPGMLDNSLSGAGAAYVFIRK